MKNFTLIISALLVCGLIVYDAPDNYVHGRLDGAPAGRTGSPGDGSSCNNGCHGNSPGNGLGNEVTTITHNIPAGGYGPGNTYDITVTTTSSGTNSFGFSLSPQNVGGAILGSLIAGTDTELNGGGGYITHSENVGAGTKSWDFQWTAPPASTGAVTFYCASLYGNDNLTNAGDFMVLSSESIQEGTTVGLFEAENQVLSVYPNPAVDVIRLNAKLTDQASFEIIDLEGSILQSGVIVAGGDASISLDRTAVNSGLHLLRLSNNESSITSRIVVQ